MEKCKLNNNCKFSIEDELEIIDKYINENKSMKVLGKEYSCDPSTIMNILKRYNIKSRTLSEARRKNLNFTLNEDIFSDIDSPDKAYWLGVMYADGYIMETKYTNKFGISVKQSDKEWLEKFSTFLNYGEVHEYREGKTGYNPGAMYARLLIGSNKIVQDLVKWGVVPHKSKVLTDIPDIPFKLDFIRGYIDGDGSLGTAAPNIQISGTKELLLDIANYLDIPYKLYKDKSIYSLKYNRLCSSYLEKILYKDANYYLDRKYDIAKRSFSSPLTLKDVKEKSLKLRGTPESLNN